MRDWKTVWNERQARREIEGNTTEEVFGFLKNALDITAASGKRADSAAMIRQFDANLAKIGGYYPGVILRSFFDVGCGTGAYLYYLCRRFKRIVVGGSDYSTSFIETAKSALQLPDITAEVKELYCAEAIDTDTDIHYDCVFSRSIFQYFPNEAYGIQVAEKMLEKANYCIAIFDLFDQKKQEEFLANRRSKVENYDEKYRDTPFQFYSKEQFLKLAEKHQCDVLFARDPLMNYWNETFSFDVYLYKHR